NQYRIDIALRARREGTAAKTADRSIEYAQALLQTDTDIVERVAAGVVIMTGKAVRRSNGQHRIKHGGNLVQRTAPDGVAEAHLVTAEREELLGHIGHRLWGNRPIIRAFDRAAHIA